MLGLSAKGLPASPRGLPLPLQVIQGDNLPEAMVGSGPEDSEWDVVSRALEGRSVGVDPSRDRFLSGLVWIVRLVDFCQGLDQSFPGIVTQIEMQAVVLLGKGSLV